MLGLGLSLTNFGTKGGVADTPDLSGSSAAAFLALWSTDGQGLVFDFADDQSVKIVDTSTPANNKDSSGYIPVSGALVGPGSVLTYTSPSPKLCLQSTGYYAYQAHNLCLQSETWTTTWNPNVTAGTGSAVTVTANYAANPVDGAMTASRLQFALNGGTTTSDISKIFQPIAEVAGAKYSGYIWARSTDGTSSYAMQMLTPGGGVACTITGTWQKIEFSAVAAIGSASNLGLQLRGGQTPTNSNSADIIVHRAHKYLYPANTDYIRTTSAKKYALPYEWNTSGTCQGIRVEEARTNLCLYSNDLTNAAWTKSNMSTAKTATGYDNVANSATTLTATAANATALQAITSASAARITHCAIKRRTGSGNIDLTQDNGSTWTTQTVTSSWAIYELSSVTSANPTVGIRIVTSGDAVDVMYFQHSVGAFRTSPIETYSSTVTRAADSHQIATSRFPYAQATSTLFVDFEAKYNVANGRILSLYGSGSVRQADFYYSTSASIAAYNQCTGGGLTAFYSSGAPAAGLRIKLAQSISADDLRNVADGSVKATDTTITMDVAATTLALCGYPAGSYSINGYLKRAAYFPQITTTPNMQTMTT